MTLPSRICAVSVDLDEVPNYHGIHGLPPPDGPGKTAVYDLALERLKVFAETHHIPLTLFAIGSDLKRPQNAERLLSMAAVGHEIANHTMDHRYDLTRLPDHEMRRQILDCIEMIERAVGKSPLGFRSPGYVITDALAYELRDAGVLYDSSVFPCPMYYGAKATTMGAMMIRGRSSYSVFDHPRVLIAPTRPYRMGEHFHQKGDGLVELPVQVTPGLRLPFIGTMLTMGGLRAAQWLTAMVAREPFINLELHGIDFLDARDGLEGLVDFQPDVRKALSHKQEIFSTVVQMLRQRGYVFVRLREVAAEMAESSSQSP